MPTQMSADTVQMQMIRRYARILREQQARNKGPRIGAKQRRVAGGAKRTLPAARAPKPPAV